MKLFIIFGLSLLYLNAQETYTKGKIDMHGGSQEKYYNNFNSMTSYKDGALKKSPSNLSNFLDKNSTKK